MVFDRDFTLLGDGLDRHSWSEEKGEDFYILVCKNLKMTSVDIDEYRSARIWKSELQY